MPRTYYCHHCAAKRNYLAPFHTTSLLDTPYQLVNYMKHTVPDATYKIQSVFSSTSTEAFADYVVNSSLAGSVEIDDLGRKNIIWSAGKDIGFRYEQGFLIHPEDVVKVVLSTDSGRVHAYSQSSTQFDEARCVDCGNPILY